MKRRHMDKVLSSWKEIASHLGKSVRTVQRWEAMLDLPVHRPGGRPGILLAYQSELDRWAHSTRRRRNGNGSDKGAQPQARYADVHRRAMALRDLAGRRIEELRATTRRTEELWMAIGRLAFHGSPASTDSPASRTDVGADGRKLPRSSLRDSLGMTEL